MVHRHTICMDGLSQGRWGTLAVDAGTWHSAGEHILGRPEDVHVYQVALRTSTSMLDCSLALLSHDEMDRADRFRSPRDRARFIVAHGALREIVGAYTRVPPARLEFMFSPLGKPSLSGNHPGRRVEFNMSHAGDLALIALSGVGPLGVDVEEVREENDPDELADACLATDERAALVDLPARERIGTIYRWWTRKEAVGKARGEGLAMRPDQCKVIPPFLMPEGDGGTGETFWRVWDMAPCPGYVATLVAGGADRCIRLLVHEPLRSIK